MVGIEDFDLFHHMNGSEMIKDLLIDLTSYKIRYDFQPASSRVEVIDILLEFFHGVVRVHFALSPGDGG